MQLGEYINMHGNIIRLTQDMGNMVRYYYEPLGFFTVKKSIIARDWKLVKDKME